MGLISRDGRQRLPSALANPTDHTGANLARSSNATPADQKVPRLAIRSSQPQRTPRTQRTEKNHTPAAKAAGSTDFTEARKESKVFWQRRALAPFAFLRVLLLKCLPVQSGSRCDSLAFTRRSFRPFFSQRSSRLFRQAADGLFLFRGGGRFLDVLLGSCSLLRGSHDVVSSFSCD
jgi:hypothetical protein